MRLRFLILLMVAVAAGALRASPAFGRLESRVTKVIASSGSEVAVGIKDLCSGAEILINADRSMPVAAGIRIHLIAELFRQAADGRLSLEKPYPLPESARAGGLGVLRYMGGGVSLTLRDYASLVVTAGDNTAANVLAAVVGMEAVNESLTRQGTPEIRFRRIVVGRRDAAEAPENIATARATLRALEMLHAGRVVDRSISDEILGILRLPEVSYSRRKLPRGIQFAGLSGHGPGVRSDQGIVLLEEHPLAVCVLIRNPAEKYPRFDQPSRSDALMTQVWEAIVSYLTEARTSGLPPSDSGRGRPSE
ncbi:MAG: serine hydrolase [Opitutaceae bacterium]